MIAQSGKKVKSIRCFLRKTVAFSQRIVYNTYRTGVWCNGSTKASDSFGVSSILTTPAIKKASFKW